MGYYHACLSSKTAKEVIWVEEPYWENYRPTTTIPYNEGGVLRVGHPELRFVQKRGNRLKTSANIMRHKPSVQPRACGQCLCVAEGH